MIDFRYHLVSIVAVFLALAVGLLVGSTSKVREVVDKAAQNTTAVVQKHNDELRVKTLNQQDELEGENEYGAATTQYVLPRRLAGESVVLVLAPGADDAMRTGVSRAVTAANGSVSGWVSLQDKYFDPSQVALVDQIALSSKPAALNFATDASAHDKAAAVLANVLVTKDAAKKGREEVGAGTTLSSFKEAGLLTFSGTPTARATLAVVIAPKDPVSDGGTAEADNKALISLTAALDGNDKGTVAAGSLSSAGTNGFLNALRSSSVEKTVSSVDAADRVTGQNVVVIALDSEMDGKTGQWGNADSADAYLPTPLPAVH
ncbi:copper transporter [Actinocorallia lasiicapitis]